MYPSSKYRYFSLHCPISFGQQFCPNHFIHIIVDFHGVVVMANDAWMEATQPVFIDIYLKFSKIVREIYLRYSPEVEAFGIDESWIELTGSHLLQHQTPLEIANEIRETVKSEVGLTVSIGVSFNKILRSWAPI